MFSKKATATATATAHTHCMIQIAPLIVDGFKVERTETIREEGWVDIKRSIPAPDELSPEVHQKVVAAINKEVEDFCKWTGLGREDIAVMPVCAGYETVFCYMHTIPPDGRENFGSRIESFIADMTSACLLGDKGTEWPDGQTYKKRCRWAFPWGY